MPILNPGEEVNTTEAVFQFDGTAQGPLTIGQHVFRLVVRDEAGNVSEPATLELVVVDQNRPTAVLRLRGGGNQVPFGRPFVLEATDSADPEGRIVEFQWTLVR